MRQYNLLAILMTAVVAVAAPARAALLFDYSFNLTGNGTVTGGTVAGEIDLPFVAAGGTGSGAADTVTIDSFPSGLAPLPQPSPATDWTGLLANVFNVTDGAITSYQFAALTSVSTDAYMLCFNSLGLVSIGPQQCPTNLNYFGGGRTFGFNQDGPAGITFTPVSAAPEPTTIALLGAALVGFAVSCRRRRPAAQRRARRWSVMAGAAPR